MGVWRKNSEHGLSWFRESLWCGFASSSPRQATIAQFWSVHYFVDQKLPNRSHNVCVIIWYFKSLHACYIRSSAGICIRSITFIDICELHHCCCGWVLDCICKRLWAMCFLPMKHWRPTNASFVRLQNDLNNISDTTLSWNIRGALDISGIFSLDFIRFWWISDILCRISSRIQWSNQILKILIFFSYAI